MLLPAPPLLDRSRLRLPTYATSRKLFQGAFCEIVKLQLSVYGCLSSLESTAAGEAGVAATLMQDRYCANSFDPPEGFVGQPAPPTHVVDEMPAVATPAEASKPRVHRQARKQNPPPPPRTVVLPCKKI